MSKYQGDWLEFLDMATAAVADAEDVPDRGEEFASSVMQKIESIADTVEMAESVSAAQWRALRNMHSGIKKWLR